MGTFTIGEASPVTVTAELRDAETPVAEPAASSGQLRAAAVQLDRDPADGPCGPACACLASDTGAVPVDISNAPIACTLEPGTRADRVAELADALAGATRRTAVDGGLRIGFGPDVGELGRSRARHERRGSGSTRRRLIDRWGG